MEASADVLLTHRADGAVGVIVAVDQPCTVEELFGEERTATDARGAGLVVLGRRGLANAHLAGEAREARETIRALVVDACAVEATVRHARVGAGARWPHACAPVERTRGAAETVGVAFTGAVTVPVEEVTRRRSGAELRRTGHDLDAGGSSFGVDAADRAIWERIEADEARSAEVRVLRTRPEELTNLAALGGRRDVDRGPVAADEEGGRDEDDGCDGGAGHHSTSCATAKQPQVSMTSSQVESPMSESQVFSM